MKLPSLLLAIFAATTLSLHAQVSPIRIAVEQASKTETKDKTGRDKTQIRSLKITLNNNSAEAFDGLAVKYWFLGREAKEPTVKVLAEGERKSSLIPRGKDLVESESVSKRYTEERVDRGKKVPASGEKISGYAVRVMKDGKVLAEYYSEPSYKTLIK